LKKVQGISGLGPEIYCGHGQDSSEIAENTAHPFNGSVVHRNLPVSHNPIQIIIARRTRPAKISSMGVINFTKKSAIAIITNNAAIPIIMLPALPKRPTPLACVISPR
jgi:hypothetical protein